MDRRFKYVDLITISACLLLISACTQAAKETRRAIKDFNIAIGLAADFAKPYFFRGKARLNIGQADQGLADIEKAAELGYGWASRWLEERNKHDD